MKKEFRGGTAKIIKKTIKVTSDGDRLDFDGSILGGFNPVEKTISYVELAPKRECDKSNPVYERFNKYSATLNIVHEKRHEINNEYMRRIGKFSQDLQFMLRLHDETSACIAELLEIRRKFKATKKLPMLMEFSEERNKCFLKYTEWLSHDPAALAQDIPTEYEAALILDNAIDKIDFEFYAQDYVKKAGKTRMLFPNKRLTNYSFDEIVGHLYDFESDHGRPFNFLSLLSSKTRDYLFTEFTRIVMEAFNVRAAALSKGQRQ